MYVVRCTMMHSCRCVDFTAIIRSVEIRSRRVTFAVIFFPVLSLKLGELSLLPLVVVVDFRFHPTRRRPRKSPLPTRTTTHVCLVREPLFRDPSTPKRISRGIIGVYASKGTEWREGRGGKRVAPVFRFDFLRLSF